MLMEENKCMEPIKSMTSVISQFVYTIMYCSPPAYMSGALFLRPSILWHCIQLANITPPPSPIPTTAFAQAAAANTTFIGSSTAAPSSATTQSLTKEGNGDEDDHL